MARVLFAIELGGELGHLRACSQLANALRPRGHEIAFAVSELHDPAKLSTRDPCEVFRFAVGRSPLRETRPVSYAEVLVGVGYQSPEALAPIAEPWRRHLRDWKPDLVIADYAPTAMLAARCLGVPRVNFGMGFTVPPRLSPLPSFRFDEPVDAARVQAADSRALAAVNGVLAAWNEAPLRRLADFLECDEDFLCTFPELDHYGNRPASGYWGPRFDISSGARYMWPAAGGKRIFLYLKTSLPQLDAVIDLLAASDHRVAAFIPNLDEERRRRLVGPHRYVSASPILLEPLLADCDLAITNAGQLSQGLTTLGIPQLVFPLQFEQYITARRIEQVGCGLWLGPKADKAAVADAMRTLLFDPARAASARAFARRYPAFSLPEQRRRMVHRIEEIVRGHGATRHILPASSNKESPT